MSEHFIEAERDQDADCIRIEAEIRLAEQGLAALKTEQLDPDEAQKQWLAIRDRTILAVRDLRRHIVKRANEAKATKRRLIETFFREKVAHPGNGEARPSLEYSAILQDIPTKGLLDHIRYLVQVGDFVRVQSIRAAFEAREDRYRYAAAFERTLVQLAFAERKDLDARLARICRLAEEADTKITDLFLSPNDTRATCRRSHNSSGRSQEATSFRLQL
jgi:hypothetical protein